LIRFDPAPVLDWACAKILSLRGNVASSQTDELSLLGEYLDEYAGCRLVLASNINAGMGVGDAAVVKQPGQGSPLVARFELDTKLAYVSRKHLTDYVQRRRGDINKLRNALTNSAVLQSSDARKILGSGTNISGSQVPCWKLDLSHPIFAALMAGMTAEANAPKEKNEMNYGDISTRLAAKEVLRQVFERSWLVHYARGEVSKPLTRRERIERRLADYRYRVVTAWRVLRGDDMSRKPSEAGNEGGAGTCLWSRKPSEDWRSGACGHDHDRMGRHEKC
jgi:hypothetical protein